MLQPLLASALASRNQSARPRVLVVDDDIDVARLMVRALRPSCDVVEVHDGGIALLRITAGDPYDVILLDLHLPRVDGRAIYEKLSVAAPSLLDDVVIVTGGAKTSEETAFLASIPNEMLEKPFAIRDLRAVVERARRRRTGRPSGFSIGVTGVVWSSL